MTIRKEIGNKLCKIELFFNLVKKILWNCNIREEIKGEVRTLYCLTLNKGNEAIDAVVDIL